MDILIESYGGRQGLHSKINVIVVDVPKRPDRKKGSLTSSVPTGIYVVVKIRIM